MKTFSAEFAARLSRETTTLANCWTITRRDGAVFGFTDHDRTILLNGIAHQPQEGLETGASTAGPGFAAGSAEAAGFLSSQAVSEEDLAAGLWDGASVEIRKVDWSDPAVNALLNRAEIGEVSRDGATFRAELRSLSHRLNEARGRVFSSLCDADLGDARCRVDLVNPAFGGDGLALGQSDAGRLMLSGFSSFAPGWFSGGRLTVASGQLAGRSVEIVGHRAEDDAAVIDTLLPLSQPLPAGTAVSLRAGCDKRFATCRAKFDNALNFQGFPQMPGSDFVLGYPGRDTGTNDGGPVVG